jgi:hypothetical protein
MSSLKQPKENFLRVVVENEVMATSRKYSTELMVQKGIVEINMVEERRY